LREEVKAFKEYVEGFKNGEKNWERKWKEIKEK